MTERRANTHSYSSGLAVVLCLAALALMVSDARLQLAEPLRRALATMLYPAQLALKQPVDLLNSASSYLSGLDTLRERNEILRQTMTRQARLLAQTEMLRQENQALRALAGLQPRIETPGLIAEVVMQPRSPGSQKRLLNRGSRHGVLPGQPVLDFNGVIGQITRVYPHSSEMTLLTDSAISVPVTVQRTRQNAIAFGDSPPDRMALRFQPGDSDLRAGDLLQTSGLDFLYPPGLPVGVIEQISRSEPESFAEIAVRPLANTRNPRLVLVLLAETRPPLLSRESSGAPAEAAAAAAAGTATATGPDTAALQ